MRAMLSQKGLIGLVTESTKELVSRDVVYLDLVKPTPRAEFSLVWWRDDGSPLVHAFLAIARDIAQNT